MRGAVDKHEVGRPWGRKPGVMEDGGCGGDYE